ncbi:senecionine N-oxygenase-like [Acropora millepora]|uniref:senecionine N-oxygenase-like n=1 Tax=Acropora millepora TaxID=45264 RepID=UPI001CF210B6|nr:senecionine N-oxygenase-like [Acropora millepora]XP_029183411.2 senecionine N-oxygenase-like [Acropora millepora]XP_044175989.1 senecionine N-oxygenase-like [Acropora millepora]XP_044175993.1 senecionine N-oxygenase-like [Acropora millepora]XP_044175998.1 senecionine N-oxygenase-like [Acropora millepora]
MSTDKVRVCVIGAGPSGLSVLYQFNQLKAQGEQLPEIVCFEKQSDWGGLWKFSNETGTDKYGEPVHGSMYQGLWSNGPKECLEFPDYTFDEHFGKAIPSYPPREAIYDYLKGRWTKHDLRHWIRFEHVVQQVTFNEATNDFSVVVKNLPEDRVLAVETFNYVVVAVGHFSVPNVPDFPGIDQFNGRVIHSHDFRDASHFEGKRILLVGASYSAEDIALQCLKYGAKNVICTWRTNPMGFKWPSQISERPLLTKINGNTVQFRDGSSAEVDDIILCTGYQFSYPFMEERLCLKTPNVLYPEGLYKAIMWTGGGNNKVLYIGALDQFYTFTLFEVQAVWAVFYIMGKIKLPDQHDMVNDMRNWISRMEALKAHDDGIDFQTDYMTDLVKQTSYAYNLDASAAFHDWAEFKKEDIATYRSQCHSSIFTGKKSSPPNTPFMHEFDDSLQHFLNPNQ